jgi:hypothetical protein
MLMAHDADDERSASEGEMKPSPPNRFCRLTFDIDENPQMVELQARLLKAQDDLQRVQNEVSELWTKLLMAERELKVEQEINNIAWRFIPEEKRSDYVLEWPNRQHDWAESPPHASVTSFDWKDFTESD